MNRELQEIAEVVRRESGIDVRRMGSRSLEAAMAKVAPGDRPGEVLRALSAPRAGASLRARLIEAVAVHETFFFRQPDDLDAIDWHALLALAHAAGSDRVRVWVAACATGEEAYTIGIMASEAFGSPTPPVSILATDISAAALLRAEHANYRGRAVHAVKDHLIGSYFEKDGEMLAINDALRALVHIRRHNLVRDPPPAASGPFELILCRNALIYFGPETVEQVLALLEDALVEGGTLIISAADRLCGPTGPRPPKPRETPVPSTTAWRRPRHPHRHEAHQPARDARGPPAAAPARAEPPPGAEPADVAARLTRAMACADAGRLAEAVATTAGILEEDPLNVDAHFIRGIAELGLGDAAAASESLRRALYVEPGFALAAFKLGSAYDARGDEQAARRAYAQALRTLTPDDPRHKRLAGDIDAADVAAACRARLAAPSGRGGSGRR